MAELDGRIAYFTELCDAWKIENINELVIRLQEIGFFDAPASTKYHGSHEGGLFEHSCAVYNNLWLLTKRNELVWKRPRSPFIVGMFHDLRKADQYQHSTLGVCLNGDNVYDTTKWEYREQTILKGHGDKSVMLLSTLMKLTEEEVLCIRYHMGAFDDKSEWSNYTNAIHLYKNVLWTHQADMMAAHIDMI